MESITLRLETEIGNSLFSQPPQAASIRQPDSASIATDSEIWLRFSQLGVNASELEIKQIHTLSIVEKESQCESAKIVAILGGEERREALELLNLPYPPTSTMPLVCRLSEDSCDVKFKEDDFTCSITPLSDPLFLSSEVSKYVSKRLPPWITTMAELTSVSVQAMDRDKRLIVLALKNAKYDNALDAIRDLMRRRVIDPNEFLIEKVAVEFFMEKFHRVITAIGNPLEVKNSIAKRLGYSDLITEASRPLSASTPAASLLITGSASTAIDNVLQNLYRNIAEYYSNEKKQIPCVRFEGSPNLTAEIPEYKADGLPLPLKEMFWQKNGIIIVGSTPQQVYKLPNSQENPRSTPFRCGGLFDLILLDEASQVEVSQAILIFSTLAAEGSVVISGDPLQMPPIQQAEIPKRLAPMLGSVYDFFSHEKTYGIRPNELLVNYRSNAAIVNLAREANYPPGLESHSPNLAIRLKSCTENKIESWITRIIDPSIAVSAFIHKDGKSNQLNPFEASAIEKIIRTLRENLLQTLENDGTNASEDCHTNESFWTKGIGIVTQHRAQQALIIRRLQNVFCKGRGEGTAKLKI